MLGTLPTKKVQRLQEKVKYHRLEKERTKSRLREVSRSRDNWKEKARKRLERCHELEQRIKKLESQLASPSVPSSRAARHHYPLWLVWLCLMLRNQGVCSLRVCAELIAQLSLVLELGLGRPSPSSISNWECKLGLYHLLSPPPDPDTSEQHWCLFIDESFFHR